MCIANALLSSVRCCGIYIPFIPNHFIMSCLQWEIDISYDELILVFGEPNVENDGYKVDAEWQISTPFGDTAIYNYKTGKNYLWDEGDDVKDIRDWHIGWDNHKQVGYIYWYVASFLEFVKRNKWTPEVMNEILKSID